MGRLSLALILRYFELRWRWVFYGWLGISFFTFCYSLIHMFTTDRLAYPYFEKNLLLNHQLNTVFYLHSLILIIGIILYLSHLNVSLHDVFLKPYLRGTRSPLFHLFFLGIGCLIFGGWTLFIVQILNTYYSETHSLPFRWIFYMVMDGFFMYALWVYLKKPYVAFIYALIKVIALTTGLSGPFKHLWAIGLNYAYFDETWHYPYPIGFGFIVMVLIHILGLIHLNYNKYL